jgi:PAS domain S-box-containing protein
MKPQFLILRVFLVSAGLLVGGVFLMYWVGASALAIHDRVSFERALLQHLEETGSTLKDAETGQRGYLLTGDEQYLSPYRQALTKLHDEQAALRGDASAGELPPSDVQTLVRLSEAKLAELEQTIQLRRTGGLAAALPVVLAGQGKATMDQLRAEIARLSAGKGAEFQQARARAGTVTSLRNLVYVLMTAFNLGVLAWAYRRIVSEIHGREAAVEETNRRKELLATTLSSIGDGVIATDPQGRVSFLNPEAQRLTGWTEHEAMGQTLLSVFHIINEQTRQPAENPVEKVIRTGKVAGLANHTILIAKDGTERPIDDSAAPIRMADGSLSGVVLAFRDFTQQRMAQQARARLAAIVEFSGDAILTKNLDGKIQTWNYSAERLFGYRAEEIVGKPVTLLFPPDRLNEEDRILERLRQGQPSERLETIRLSKDGRRIPVSESVSPIKDAEGNVTGASKIMHDISELLEARQALVREKELLATTLASIGDAVIVTDAEGRVTFLNAAAERLTAWTLSEAAGQPLPEVFRIVNEATRLPAENPVAKVIRLGHVVGLANHTVLLAKDGREIAIDDSAAPIRHGQGPLLGVVLVFRDFTQRRLIEQTLRENQERLAGLIDSAMDAIIAVDEKQQIVLFNPAAEQVFGCAATEALSSSLDRFIPARFRQAHRRHISTFGETGVTNRRMGALGALSGLRTNGEEFPIEAAISQMKVRGQTLFTVILRDITERQKAEERQAQLAAIIDSSRDAVISKSLDGIVISWNPAAEALFGYSAAEMIGQSILRIVPPDGVAEETELLKRLQSGQGVEHYETTRVTRTGQRVPGLVTVSPIRDATGKIVRASTIIHDITERKATELALAAAKAELEQANRDLEKRVEERTAKLKELVSELEHVSYAMVHDMRAPLRAMHAFAQILSDNSPDDSPEQRQDYLARIMTGANRLDKLIQDALNYNRAVLEDLPLERVALTPLLRGLIETYPNLNPTNADIRIDGELPAVLGNESLLTQCFSNLLGNAVKFVAAGVRPQVSIRAQLKEKDSPARIWVEDNGIGIPENAQKRLFGMFQKLDSQYEGTGIGLAIVRKVVERMGGKVGVESTSDRGSRFWVELPLAPARGAESGGVSVPKLA